MDTNKKRVEWIDFVKGIAILCVVWKHIKWEPDVFGKIICAFHMPIFFIISGILLFMKDEINNQSGWGGFIKKKAMSLLYPYFCFSIIGIFVLLLRHRFTVGHIINTITLTGYSVFWFLPCLFFTECLGYWIIKNKNKKYNYVVMLGVGVVSIFGLQFIKAIGIENEYILSIFINIARICTSLIFVVIGYVGYEYLTENIHIGFVTGIIFIISGVVAAVLNTGEVIIKDNILYNPILFFLSANMISWGIIFCVKNIKMKSNVIHFWGRNSLIILVTHLPMAIVSIVTWKFPLKTNIYVLDCIVAFIVVMIIESILICVINKWFPFLIKLPKRNKG